MSRTTSINDTVEVRDSLDAKTFSREYVNRRPVVIKGALREMRATSRWTIPYLASLAPDLRVRLKTGQLAEGKTMIQTFDEYSTLIDDVVEGRVTSDGPLPYLHDLPLFAMMPQLRDDVVPFPMHMLPRFFRKQWWVFMQFFVGPPGSLTPLHFDSLQTHNLFFQLHGQKRFLVVNPADRKYCYLYNWRWSHVDAEDPDFEAHPLFRNARVSECVVEPGDLLYMPPGTPHHVRSLTSSISFNVDWHDRRSSLHGLIAACHGMPLQNLRYNAMFALGVWTGIPLRVLMPGLKSYFYYISL
jgi:ribosomal protein L16 Arg81 hydroxylase